MTSYLSEKMRKGRRDRPRYSVLSLAAAPTWPTALSLNSFASGMRLRSLIYNSAGIEPRTVGANFLGRLPEGSRMLRRARGFDSGATKPKQQLATAISSFLIAWIIVFKSSRERQRRVGLLLSYMSYSLGYRHSVGNCPIFHNREF